MKQIALFILSGLLIFSSCRKEELSHSPREVRNTFQPNMKIDTFITARGIRYTVAPGGDDNVFQYSNRWGMNDDYSDNEYSANIWFPVSPDLTSFSYTDAQLAEHRCYYNAGGAWTGDAFEVLDNGVISGVKNADGSWEIVINIILKNADPRLETAHITTKATFIEGKY